MMNTLSDFYFYFFISDELFGDNPTLFAVEDGSAPGDHHAMATGPHTGQHQNTSASRFAIDDDNDLDDGFDDFADCDEEAALTLPMKKGGKDHLEQNLLGFLFYLLSFIYLLVKTL